MNYEIIFVSCVVICFLGICNLLLYILPARKAVYHDDVERAEAYVFSKSSFDHVFIGSGLIGHIDPRTSRSCFNLYFPYYGSCTGLQVIALSNKIPKAIFLETNFIFKGTNERVIAQLFSSWSFWLKRFVPFALKKNNPVKWIKQFIHAMNLTVLKTSMHTNSDQVRIEELIEIFNRSPDLNKLRADLNILKTNIDMLSAKGCHIFFVQVPVDPILSNAKLFQIQYAELKKLFESKTYKWISDSVGYRYQTEDGLHLTAESSNAFRIYLQTEIAKLNI